MASLIVKFADLASEPVGSGNAVSAEVLVSYTREVPLTDGTVLQPVPMRKQLGPGGTAIFEVTPADDSTVVEAHRDFGLRVEWLLTHRVARSRQTETRGSRTVKVTVADGGTVQFGDLVPTEPVPAKYVSVADFADDLEAQVGEAVGDATQALTAAQAAAQQSTASAADAALAVTRAENAEGVALAPAAEVIADTFSNSTTAAVQRGGVLTPVTVDHAGLQAALDTGHPQQMRVQAAGYYSTDQTLVIARDADLSGLTINYTGTGAAVQLGAGPILALREVHLPRILCGTKPASGWSQAIGVEVVNLISTPYVSVPLIKNFADGLVVRGQGTGVVHDTFLLGDLDNNKRNLVMTSDASGWVNSCTWVGGRFRHRSSEGQLVSGATHIVMENNPFTVNNHVFINPSVEGDVAEFHLDILNGNYNEIVNPRLEANNTGGGRVRWGAKAKGNRIRGGYRTYEVTQTRVAGEEVNGIDSADVADITSDQSFRPHDTHDVGRDDLRPRRVFAGTEVVTPHITTDAGPQIIGGSGTPSVAAPPGSLYLRKQGGKGVTAWAKESGTGEEGWAPVGLSMLVANTSTDLTLNNVHQVVQVSADATITLPGAFEYAGRVFRIKATGANGCTVTSQSAIDGQTSQSVPQWGCLTVIGHASGWLSI